MVPLVVLILLSACVSSIPLETPICGYDACPPTSPDVLNVHIVPHSHDDLGWLKTVDQYFYDDVENLLSSVVHALRQNLKRRFVQVETGFFKKWWVSQSELMRNEVQRLVNNGQLEMINGAWSMNDEAAVNYQYTIDQYTLGLRFLDDNLGECARPRVGWQIDPFGHSREHASLNAQLGFDSLFFARLDYRDKINRLQNKNADLIWRGTSNLGNNSDIFTSVLYNHYSAPPGFCFDIVCSDEPIIDDLDSPDYNYKARVEQFASFLREQASRYATNNILVVMGDDFRYEAAFTSYINTDKLIRGFELFPQSFQNLPIVPFYSTPSCYAKAVNEYTITKNLSLQIKTDDFFPYADGVGSLVVGYFTSRPASKRFIREGNNFLQVVKQLSTIAKIPYENLDITSLKEAMGVLQHHDAITGTELIAVTHDYHRMLSEGLANAGGLANDIISGLVTGANGTDLGFRSCLLANASYCPETKQDQFSILVYNPLSRVVSSPVRIPVDSSFWQILDPNGNQVLYQVDPSITDFTELIDEPASGYSLEFIAEELPPLGYKTYTCTRTGTASKPTHAVNEGADFTIDGTTGLLSFVTLNGVTLDVKQEFLYYGSAGNSQAYIFAPDGTGVKAVAAGAVSTTPIDGDIYRGMLQVFSPWVKQIIKIYKHDPTYIDFDWVVGPIDFSTGGKEVISRFTFALENNGTFYTDSNGREMLQRIRNFRPDYSYTNEQPEAGNYYPVTSKIVVNQTIDESTTLEAAILTDRSEGGSSLSDGEVELMVHRALRSLDQDSFGLDEEEYGHQIVVRGTHTLVLGSRSTGDGSKSLPALERDLEQRKLHQPWIFFTNQDIQSLGTNLQYTNLKRPLPLNVQILTLESWKEDIVLLRLEHILERDEDPELSNDVVVDLSDLFVAFSIEEIQETTLAGNIRVEDNIRLSWPGSVGDSGTKIIDGLLVSLAPMQIRTFLAKVAFS